MDLSQSVGACPVCRSIRYHRNDEGFVVCEFGHQSQAFWEEHDDQETFFGTTKRLASRGSQSRCSQTVDEPTSSLLRSGDVDKFVMLEIIQLLLKRQIQDLHSLIPDLTPSFDTTVRSVWLTYVSNLQVKYSEEGITEAAPSETSSRRGSFASLSGFESEKDLELSDDDLDLALLRNHPSGSAVEQAANLTVKPDAGRIRMTICVPILALALHYHQAPVYAYDLYSLAIKGSLFFFNVFELIPKGLTKHLSPSQRSYFQNPLMPSYQEAGLSIVQLARLMHQTHGVALPTLDARLLFWRIGELLKLPYLFREDLIALALKLDLSFTVGLVHERCSHNPLVNAFALTIFYLKLHYGLADSSLTHSENMHFEACGLPTHYQLQQVWKRLLADMEDPHDYTHSSVLDDLDFYKSNVIRPKIKWSRNMKEEDFAQVKRSLKPSAREAHVAERSSPGWLSIDPDRAIEITDLWAKKYAYSSFNSDEDFASFSDSYRILVEIGTRFASCEDKRVESTLCRIFESVDGNGLIRGLFMLNS